MIFVGLSLYTGRNFSQIAQLAILLIQAPYLNLPWILHSKSLFFGMICYVNNTILGASLWLSGNNPPATQGIQV